MGETRWLDAREARAWRTLQMMQMRLDGELARQLATDSGLSYQDYTVLVALTGQPEGRMRAFELDEIRRELHAAAGVELHREAQEDRRVAGGATVHQPDLRGLVLLEDVEVRHRHRGDVREHLAVRAVQREPALLVVVQASRRVDVDRHEEAVYYVCSGL